VFWCVLGHAAVSGRPRPQAEERALTMEVCPNDQRVGGCFPGMAGHVQSEFGAAFTNTSSGSFFTGGEVLMANFQPPSNHLAHPSYA
jgi:hypothetical protein